MNSIQTLGKWFYIGLIMLQIVFLILKFTGILHWSVFWILSPILLYLTIKLLYRLGEALSNLINYLLGVSVVVIIIAIIVYLLLL